MPDPMLIARGSQDVRLLPRMENRHGLIAGATGTGKTVTLQVLAEHFSRAGVPVFAADIKGDLSGISRPGTSSARLTERLRTLRIADHEFAGCPTVFWDVFGERGHPARTTISEMGPLLLSRLLNLNDTQEGVITLVFRVADDNGLLLLDLADLRAMLQHVGDNAATYKTQYGNVSPASIGAIQRGLLALEEQGGEHLFGEPSIMLEDLMQTDANGNGVVNLLVADRLLNTPQVYTSFLLWLLSELFEGLPEVGDLDKPKLVFFFDEAHLLFDDAPKALLDRIEQVTRLIRSKGVGVYFVTQNPLDIPHEVLGQLGNRVQHALRAFTPRDQKAVRAAAETFRANPAFKVEDAITQLGVGEALVSVLDDDGAPTIVERALIMPPHGQIGAIDDAQRKQIMASSVIAGHYEKEVDRESAYEMLKTRAAASEAEAARDAAEREQLAEAKRENARAKKAPAAPRRRQSDSMAETVAKSTARSASSQLGRSLTRGILGSLFGKRRS
ncbi:MAG: helicase HerA-like domain-containing protein [Dehalococcoidia bacterium]